MFGLHLLDLAVGFVIGGVVCVVVPSVYTFFHKQTLSAEARITVLEQQLKAKTGL